MLERAFLPGPFMVIRFIVVGGEYPNRPASRPRIPSGAALPGAFVPNGPVTSRGLPGNMGP